jgi:GNAT superfamily N-acetyltransferase
MPSLKLKVSPVQTPAAKPKDPLCEGIHKLEFRSATKGDLESLKAIYESAWGCGIKISIAQLSSMIRNFQDGQIIGVQPDGVPASMINIMATAFSPKIGFTAGYERVSGCRTFSTHIPPKVLRRISGNDTIGVALCMSIAVDPALAKNGYAVQTLNHAIGAAKSMGLSPVPYSAPRGYARALIRNPGLDVIDYLHMSAPPECGYEAHAARLMELGKHRISSAFSGTVPLISREQFELQKAIGIDQPGLGAFAFREFSESSSRAAARLICREPVFEDFCALTGRKPVDPVMRLHIENGARFIRDGKGRMSAIFRDSRPEDTAAAGYNVLLTYDYNPLLVGRAL